MRVLGIDYGRRRIGLALSDEAGILASPLPTYVRSRSMKRDMAALTSLVSRYAVSSIVVGLPLNMDGSRGEMAEEVEAFADRIRQVTGLPVESFDERLTSSEAERVLLEANTSRRRRKELRDGLSAVLILQGHLDRQTPAGLPPDPTSETIPSSPPS